MSGRRAGDPRAQALLRRYLAAFPGPAVPVPVEAIAEDLLGLRVREDPSLPASGMLLPAARVIVVNASETSPRRRFTLAHEVAHWALHCAGVPPPILCRAVGPRPSADLREREANVFAAELLMPEREVVDAGARAPAASALAERFGVSPEAMAWRLFNLGIAGTPPRA